jgi:hypothetical protein
VSGPIDRPASGKKKKHKEKIISKDSEKDQRDEREKRDLGRREFWGKKMKNERARERERERERDGSDFGWEKNLTDVVK